MSEDEVRCPVCGGPIVPPHPWAGVPGQPLCVGPVTTPEED